MGWPAANRPSAGCKQSVRCVNKHRLGSLPPFPFFVLSNPCSRIESVQSYRIRAVLSNPCRRIKYSEAINNARTHKIISRQEIEDEKCRQDEIFHCHIHLIPRRKGDVENPRGGVRHIIAGKGYYEDKK